MPPWARSLIVVAVGLVAWLVATPAYAAAPLCDNRAAITLAPAPILDTPVASVDVGEMSDGDCFDKHAFERRVDESNGSRDPAPAPAHFEAAMLTQTLSVVEPLSEPQPHVDEAASVLAGVRGRVERPPRA